MSKASGYSLPNDVQDELKTTSARREQRIGGDLESGESVPHTNIQGNGQAFAMDSILMTANETANISGLDNTF
jgi:hypothetical protein